MASTFVVKKQIGSSGSPTTLPDNTNSTTITYMHLINADVDADTSTGYQTSSNQITVPAAGTAYSYELWVYGRWSGAYNTISDFKFWKSAGSLGTGLGIKWKTTATYVTPQNSAALSGGATVPTAEPGSANVTLNSPSGGVTNSQFIVLQLEVASTASPGDVGTQTYSFKWTES